MTDASTTYNLAGMNSAASATASPAHLHVPKHLSTTHETQASYALDGTEITFRETEEQAIARRVVSGTVLIIGAAITLAVSTWSPQSTQSAAAVSPPTGTSAQIASQTSQTGTPTTSPTDDSLTLQLSTLVENVEEAVSSAQELAETPVRLKQQAIEAGIPESVAQQAALDTPHTQALPNEPLIEIRRASGITAWAPASFTTSETLKQLDAAVSTYTDNGRFLSLYLLNLRSGRSISYQADKPHYPASSIKAALACMAFQTDAAQGLLLHGRIIESVSCSLTLTTRRLPHLSIATAQATLPHGWAALLQMLPRV